MLTIYEKFLTLFFILIFTFLVLKFLKVKWKRFLVDKRSIIVFTERYNQKLYKAKCGKNVIMNNESSKEVVKKKK